MDASKSFSKKPFCSTKRRRIKKISTLPDGQICFKSVLFVVKHVLTGIVYHDPTVYRIYFDYETKISHIRHALVCQNGPYIFCPRYWAKCIVISEIFCFIYYSFPKIFKISQLQVFRRPSKNKPSPNDPYVNWRETVFLNLILQQVLIEF